MCGISAAISLSDSLFIDLNIFTILCRLSVRRGSDASGVFLQSDTKNHLYISNQSLDKLLPTVTLRNNINIAIAHSRLTTNADNAFQPFAIDNTITAHNGIIINYNQLWKSIGKTNPMPGFDSSIISAYLQFCLTNGYSISEACDQFLNVVTGAVSSIVYLPDIHKVCLISNNSNLFYAVSRDNTLYTSSESSFLSKFFLDNEISVVDGYLLFDLPRSSFKSLQSFYPKIKKNVIYTHKLPTSYSESRLLINPSINLRRCSKCILPETMPYIVFDSDGVCNYCNNYVPKIHTNTLSTLSHIVKPYLTADADYHCIVPFSGGRDSTVALDLVVNHLGLKPITYTYDWGMITDLGRRNISLVCQKLGVQNILISANIQKKREYIRKNLIAWLKHPHLGMLSLLTAGDKHFFRHIETVKKETKLKLNLWGINPLEVTYFKAGFLGIPPRFTQSQVFSIGIVNQLQYQIKRYRQYLKNPAYINSSILDNLTGEYWRSIHSKSDYYAVFDYYPWFEQDVESVLDQYGWERAPDTNASWRIGDGTAAFYNYIYYLVAGFTEHDTFRSNQIREGQLTRPEALKLVNSENQPRYQNIYWYLKTIGLDFEDVIPVINAIPRLY